MHRIRCTPVCRASNVFVPAAVLARLFLPSLLRTPKRAASSSSAPKIEEPSAETTLGEDLKKYKPGREIRKANYRQQSDIVPNDLAATLEAHRDSNRRTIIRGITSANPEETRLSKNRRGPISNKRNGKTTNVVGGRNEHRKDKVEVNTAREPIQTDAFLRGDGDPSKLTVKQKRKIYAAMMKNPPKLHNRTKLKVEQALAALDYEGQNVDPIAGSVVPDTQLPWIQVSTKPDVQQNDRLSDEILAFYQWILPTATERLARRKVISLVQKTVEESQSETHVETMGSESTGLALATSDLDIRLYLKGFGDRNDMKLEKAPRMKVRRDMVHRLAELLPKFQQSGDFYLCNLRHARYPLMSLLHKDSGIDLQIVCSNATNLSRDLVLKYVEENPGLREIYAVFKIMFDVRGISDVYRGGLSSYTIFYMVVAAFRLSEGFPKENLGEQLLACLSFWANFDTTNTGISIDPPEFFKKGEKRVQPESAIIKANYIRDNFGVDLAQPYMLCIQDPAEPNNDLGRKGFGVKHIMKTLETVEKEMKKRVEENKAVSLLAPLVGSSFGLYQTRRMKMHDWAIGLKDVDLE